jgi:hypothetical protein
MIRILSVLAVAVTSAVAQGPIVRIANTTRPAGNDFRIGDRYEIVISAVAQQPVSVRTTRNGRTDWSPVIALTDMHGRRADGSRRATSAIGARSGPSEANWPLPPSIFRLARHA